MFEGNARTSIALNSSTGTNKRNPARSDGEEKSRLFFGISPKKKTFDIHSSRLLLHLIFHLWTSRKASGFTNLTMHCQIPQPSCSSKDFVCPADGVFPDPTNCTRYYICAQGSSTINQCPRNNVYDHANAGCKYRRYPSDCVNFNCVGREGQPIVYPRDDRIYGRCLLGKPYILGRCEDYERYDIKLQKCVRYCRTGGIQPPDPGLCREYILCAEILPKIYEPTPMSCACNEGYDKELNACSPNATCLKNISDLCPKKEASEENNDDDSEKSIGNDHQVTVPLIINNSGNNNDNNNVSNGDDNVDGNLVNGNDNGDNSDSGNVVKGGSTLVPLIINNSGDNNTNNKISNGDDAVDGNLINGNGNGNNSNSGNVQKQGSAPSTINSLADSSDHNDISNSNDDAIGSKRLDLQNWRQGRSLLRTLLDWLNSKVRKVPQAQPL